MAKLPVRDNQWWFDKYQLPGTHQNSRYVIVSIEGRECPMVRSAVGSDGRPTYSFTFLNAEDRALWTSLRGQQVEAEVVHHGDDPPDLDLGCGDDDPLKASPVPPTQSTGQVPPITRTGSTNFDAYLFADGALTKGASTALDALRARYGFPSDVDVERLRARAWPRSIRRATPWAERSQQQPEPTARRTPGGSRHSGHRKQNRVCSARPHPTFSGA